MTAQQESLPDTRCLREMNSLEAYQANKLFRRFSHDHIFRRFSLDIFRRFFLDHIG